MLPSAMQSALAALSAASPARRLEAVRALGRTGRPEAVEPLLVVLRSDKDLDHLALPAAALALGELGDRRATVPLIEALHDGDERVRMAAAAALARLGDPQAVKPIAGVARRSTEDFAVRLVALEALENLKAVEPLIDILNDRGQNQHLRAIAAEALGRIGDVRAVGPLTASLDDPSFALFGGMLVRRAARKALEALRARTGVR